MLKFQPIQAAGDSSCVSLLFVVFRTNQRLSSSSTAFNFHKASSHALLSIFYSYSFIFNFFALCDSIIMWVNESPPPPHDGRGMWCENNNGGTLILQIHPAGLCPASSFTVQAQNFPTKTTRIMAQAPTLLHPSISLSLLSSMFFLSSSPLHHCIFKTWAQNPEIFQYDSEFMLFL